MKPGIRSNPLFRITRHAGVVAAIGAWLSGCSAAGVLNAFVPSDSYSRLEGVAYGPQPRQLLDVYKPLTAAAPPPIVVFFYGSVRRFAIPTS